MGDFLRGTKTIDPDKRRNNGNKSKVEKLIGEGENFD